VRASFDLTDYVSVAAFDLPEYLGSSAWMEHAPFARWLVEQARPRILVELGSWTGLAYFAFCEAVERAGLATRCFAIDAWEENEQAGYSRAEVYETVFAPNARYSDFSTLVRATSDEGSERFGAGTIDLLHIDGLHARDVVRQDFEHWLPKLSDRAIVLLHDTNVHGKDFGARRLWTELAVRYPHFEFSHGNGLGVLGVGAQQPVRLSRLFSAERRSAAEIRKIYCRLGAGVADRATAETLKREGLAQLAELQRVESEVANMRADLHSAQVDLDGARADLSQATSDLWAKSLEAVALTSRLQLIEGSTIWRMTARLRSFLRHHPRMARAARGLHRGVTLQLPSRVREHRQFGADDYRRWVELYDTLDDADLHALRAAAARLTRTPLVSVVMPVYETPPEILREAIDSVLTQAYEHWELCIADDCSASREVREILQRYAAMDDRVKIVHLLERSGIGAASNAALGLASGEFVALLDHDDILRPHALFMAVSAIDEHPEAVFVYSDEDKVDDQGERYDPYFKPDWSPALFLSQNYLCHLSFFRRDRALAVGGFRQGFDGSQDWDLFLRMTNYVDADNVVHIPHVLYHWRALEGSTARNAAEKPHALAAGTRAVSEHLRSLGIEALVSTTGNMYQRVHYALPTPAPAVQVIVPTACKHSYLELLLDGVLGQTDYPNLGVTLVISDRLEAERAAAARLKRLSERPRVEVLRYQDRPFNYGWVNNLAVSQTSSEVICLLNDDTAVIHPGWLRAMVGQLLQRRVAAVGAMLYYPDNTIQHAGVVLGLGGVAGSYNNGLRRGEGGYGGRASVDQDFSCVTAGCMVIRREAFDAIGGFDERFAIAFNDVDLCLRLRERGWRIVWTPAAELRHLESTSVGQPDSPSRAAQHSGEVRLMVDRWAETLLNDPFYNPNLSLSEANELAFPPRVAYPWKESARALRIGTLTD
jgi:GT2 family glycosyltransferase